MMKRTLAWLLVLAMLFSMVTALADEGTAIALPSEEAVAEEPAGEQPDTAEPETTEPETAEPETTEPETAEPETAEPETTEPETTEPETTEPEEAVPVLYTITIPEFENGKVETKDKATRAEEGTEIELVITPCDGYVLKTIKVDKADKDELLPDENGKYIFVMPGKDIEVEAEFVSAPIQTEVSGSGEDDADLSESTEDISEDITEDTTEDKAEDPGEASDEEGSPAFAIEQAMGEATLLGIGQTLQLTVADLPEGADAAEVTWSTSDEAVATVDATGVVTGIAEGCADVTASVTDSEGHEFIARISIDVYFMMDMDIMGGDPVAKIVGTDATYGSLQDAVDAATEGQTVQLSADLTLGAGETITFTNAVTMTLDLNGYAIRKENVEATSSIISLPASSQTHLTIKDSVGGGGISLINTGSTTGYAVFAQTSNGSLTIEGGTISCLSYQTEACSVRVVNAAITVKGGVISAESVRKADAVVALDTSGTTPLISGGNLVATAASDCESLVCVVLMDDITVTGGVFKAVGGTNVTACLYGLGTRRATISGGTFTATGHLAQTLKVGEAEISGGNFTAIAKKTEGEETDPQASAAVITEAAVSGGAFSAQSTEENATLYGMELMGTSAVSGVISVSATGVGGTANAIYASGGILTLYGGVTLRSAMSQTDEGTQNFAVSFAGTEFDFSGWTGYRGSETICVNGSESSPKIKGDMSKLAAEGSSLSGGVYTTKPSDKMIATDESTGRAYTAGTNTDETTYNEGYLYMLVISSIVTNTDTGNTYFDLQTAFDEAQDGETLKLNSSYTFESDEYITVPDRLVKLDLNGKRLCKIITADGCLFCLPRETNASLTILDSAGGGEIYVYASSEDGSPLIYTINSASVGTITIEGGAFTREGGAEGAILNGDNGNGKFVIHGGTFKVSQISTGKVATVMDAWNTEITGGYFSSDGSPAGWDASNDAMTLKIRGNATISGGTFKAIAGTGRDAIAFCFCGSDPGKTVTITGGNFTAEAAGNVSAIRIDEANTYISGGSFTAWAKQGASGYVNVIGAGISCMSEDPTYTVSISGGNFTARSEATGAEAVFVHAVNACTNAADGVTFSGNTVFTAIAEEATWCSPIYGGDFGYDLTITGNVSLNLSAGTADQGYSVLYPYGGGTLDISGWTGYKGTDTLFTGDNITCVKGDISRFSVTDSKVLSAVFDTQPAKPMTDSLGNARTVIANTDETTATDYPYTFSPYTVYAVEVTDGSGAKVQYSTLDEALDPDNHAVRVELLCDITGHAYVSTLLDIELDLAGHTLTSDSGSAIRGSGTIRITDSSKDQTGKIVVHDAGAYCVDMNSAYLTIEGGTFEAEYTGSESDTTIGAVKCERFELTISGGKFIAENNSGTAIALYVADGEYTVTGGTFEATGYAAEAIRLSKEDCPAEVNFTVSGVTATATCSATRYPNGISPRGDQVDYAKGILVETGAVISGCTVNAVTTTNAPVYAIEGFADFTISGGSYTAQGKGSAYAVHDMWNLSIADGTFHAEGAQGHEIVAVYVYGKATIEDGEYKAVMKPSDTVQNEYYRVTTAHLCGNTVTVSGGKFTATAECYASSVISLAVYPDTTSTISGDITASVSAPDAAEMSAIAFRWGENTLSGDVKFSSVMTDPTGDHAPYDINVMAGTVDFTGLTGETTGIKIRTEGDGIDKKIKGDMSHLATTGSCLESGLFSTKPADAQVRTAAGYAVVANTDEETSTEYPWRVVDTKPSPTTDLFTIGGLSQTYDGTEKSATTGVKAGITGMGEFNVVYNAFGMPAVPINAGDYEIMLHVAAGEVYAEAVLTDPAWVLTISKATLTSDMFGVSGSAVYSGTAQAADIAISQALLDAGLTRDDITVNYYKDGTATDPVNAGTYTVKLSVAESTNYLAAELEDAGWTFTITPAQNAITLSSRATQTIHAAAEFVMPTVKAVAFGDVSDVVCPSGEITSIGTTTLTWTMPGDENGNWKAASVSVTVILKGYELKILRSGGGTVTSGQTTYSAGDKVTLTVTPDEGYALTTLWIGATMMSVTGDTASFRMPARDTSVIAEFSVKESKLYTVNVQAGEHGSVLVTDPLYPTRATAAGFTLGALVGLEITPDENYVVETLAVTAGDQAVGMNDASTFYMPESDVTVTVTFAPEASAKVHHAATHATCAADGNSEYWEFEGAFYSDAACTTPTTKEAVTVPATGLHNYDSFLNWMWVKNGDEDWTAFYCRACSICGGHETSGHEATVTKEISDETVTYYATAVVDGVSYTTQKTVQALYTVTLDGVTYGQYAYGATVTLTKDEGEYDWYRVDGEKETLVRTAGTGYVFVVTGEAAYVTKEATEEAATIALVSGGRETVDETSGKTKVKYTLSWTLPGGCTLVGAGIRRGYNVGEQPTMTMLTTTNAANLTKANGTYVLTVNMSAATSEKSITAVGYITYTDADGVTQTIYSDVIFIEGK